MMMNDTKLIEEMRMCELCCKLNKESFIYTSMDDFMNFFLAFPLAGFIITSFRPGWMC